MAFEVKKPPVGLRPRKYAERGYYISRLEEIALACERYYKSGVPIPQEWINEAEEMALKL